MRPLAASTLFFAVTAASCTIDDPPRLGADPSADDIRAHASRYCQKLQLCTLGQAPPDCVEKMTSRVDTPQGRRETAAGLNLFGDCMALDCVGMTACFTTASARAAIDLLHSTPKVPGPPRAPAKGP